ncbi:MAG: antitoxin Xre-like helix-turn-helix domain-containing protein [Synechococcaceae cyanobacterium]
MSAVRDANAASPLAFVAASPPAHQVALPLSDGELVLQAMLRAADELELSRAGLARGLGKDRSTLHRAKGIDPASKTGELALLLIRLYRSLSVPVGNGRLQLRYWFHTANRQPPHRRRSGGTRSSPAGDARPSLADNPISLSALRHGSRAVVSAAACSTGHAAASVACWKVRTTPCCSGGD